MTRPHVNMTVFTQLISIPHPLLFGVVLARDVVCLEEGDTVGPVVLEVVLPRVVLCVEPLVVPMLAMSGPANLAVVEDCWATPEVPPILARSGPASILRVVVVPSAPLAMSGPARLPDCATATRKKRRNVHW